MSFALFFLGEYANMILMSGDDDDPVPRRLAGAVRHRWPSIWVRIWFILKICFCLFVFIWVRGTFPRYRYDQLMRLGWKVFLPFSLLWLVLTAGRCSPLAFGCRYPVRDGSLTDGVPRPHRAQPAAGRTGRRACG